MHNLEINHLTEEEESEEEKSSVFLILFCSLAIDLGHNFYTYIEQGAERMSSHSFRVCQL
jgi:hypothetical protein